jgi:hypothetical protein
MASHRAASGHCMSATAASVSTAAAAMSAAATT